MEGWRPHSPRLESRNVERLVVGERACQVSKTEAEDYIPRLFQHTELEHTPKKPVPTGYKGNPFIVP